MKEQLQNIKFRNDTLELIDAANIVIDEFQAMGYTLTLRQLYYQFISQDLFPDTFIDEVYNKSKGLPLNTKNTVKNYKKLGNYINKGRLVGLIDWAAIEDRTRALISHTHWVTPAEVISVYSRHYNIDKWRGQEKYVEVWVEKEALIGVLEKICYKLDVPYFACRGYTSQSEMYEAGKRLAQLHAELDKEIVIIHLGDHDPSGMDMTRDNDDRLKMFSGGVVKVDRIALNMNQIKKLKLPPNPAKTTDLRATKYIEEFGHSSWELDALKPNYLSDLIDNSVNKHLDRKMFTQCLARQEEDRQELLRISNNYGNIIEFLDNDGK